MCRRFLRNVRAFLQSQSPSDIILGDATHGEKSLKSLAAAVKDGRLDALGTYGVTTILFEGPEAGDELTYQNGKFAQAFKILSTKDVSVQGCEDKLSLSTFAALKRLLLSSRLMDNNKFNELHDELVDKRMPDANESWIKQVESKKPKVILCCGTSHLPAFKHKKYFDMGIVANISDPLRKRYGYATEESNTDYPDLYMPEKTTGLFGYVEAIGAYDGWNLI